MLQCLLRRSFPLPREETSMPNTTIVVSAWMLVLITLEREGGQHGYRMVRSIAAMRHCGRTVSLNTIYPVLKKMEDAGQIEGQWKKGHSIAARQRTYNLTSRGRTRLEEVRRELSPDQ